VARATTAPFLLGDLPGRLALVAHLRGARTDHEEQQQDDERLPAAERPCDDADEKPGDRSARFHKPRRHRQTRDDQVGDERPGKIGENLTGMGGKGRDVGVHDGEQKQAGHQRHREVVVDAGVEAFDDGADQRAREIEADELDGEGHCCRGYRGAVVCRLDPEGDPGGGRATGQDEGHETRHRLATVPGKLRPAHHAAEDRGEPIAEGEDRPGRPHHRHARAEKQEQRADGQRVFENPFGVAAPPVFLPFHQVVGDAWQHEPVHQEGAHADGQPGPASEPGDEQRQRTDADVERLAEYLPSCQTARGRGGGSGHCGFGHGRALRSHSTVRLRPSSSGVIR
jgi:hypothetical protein